MFAMNCCIGRLPGAMSKEFFVESVSQPPRQLAPSMTAAKKKDQRNCFGAYTDLLFQINLTVIQLKAISSPFVHHHLTQHW